MIDMNHLPDGRVVIHYLNLLTEQEKNRPNPYVFSQGMTEQYMIAIQRAKSIGGKRYRAKWYGGGIVFDTYDAAVKDKVEQAVKVATEKENQS